MQPQPLYRTGDLHPAFALRYSWTAWPSGPPLVDGRTLLEETKLLWEGDGLRLPESCWADDKVQLTFSATPAVSPVFLATRAKGRLQHALRASVRVAAQPASPLGRAEWGRRGGGRLCE